jgi:hypothetical protein
LDADTVWQDVLTDPEVSIGEIPGLSLKILI